MSDAVQNSQQKPDNVTKDTQNQQKLKHMIMGDVKSYNFQDFLDNIDNKQKIEALLQEEEENEEDIASILYFYIQTIQAMHTSIQIDILNCSNDIKLVMSNAYDGGCEIIEEYGINGMTDDEIYKIYNINNYKDVNAISSEMKSKIKQAREISRDSKQLVNNYSTYVYIMCGIVFCLVAVRTAMVFAVCAFVVLFLFRIKTLLIRMLFNSGSKRKDYVDDVSMNNYAFLTEYNSIRDKHIRIVAYKEMVSYNLSRFIDKMHSSGIRQSNGSMLTMSDFRNALLYADHLTRMEAALILQLLDSMSLAKVVLGGGYAILAMLIAVNWRYISYFIICVLIHMVLVYPAQVIAAMKMI